MGRSPTPLKRMKKMAHQVTNAEAEKLHAEIAKLIAETAKINAEARWYPVVAAATMIGAAIALTKLFL